MTGSGVAAAVPQGRDRMVIKADPGGDLSPEFGSTQADASRVPGYGVGGDAGPPASGRDFAGVPPLEGRAGSSRERGKLTSFSREHRREREAKDAQEWEMNRSLLERLGVDSALP
jgi:hypothetical protein